MSDAGYRDSFQFAERQIRIMNLHSGVLKRGNAVRRHILKLFDSADRPLSDEDIGSILGLNRVVKVKLVPLYDAFVEAAEALDLDRAQRLHDDYMAATKGFLSQMDLECFLDDDYEEGGEPEKADPESSEPLPV